LPAKPAPATLLIDVDRLIDAYFSKEPDPSDPEQLVSFGTSGHRGSSLAGSFNQAHILAITQAICEWRQREGITGPLFLGKDTHALSRPAEQTAVEVLAANGVDTVMQSDDGYTPTPAISRLILVHNRGRKSGLGDGIVVTPSHNPPADGGFKYNPPSGGPADTSVTAWIQDRANTLLRGSGLEIRRIPVERARTAPNIRQDDSSAPTWQIWPTWLIWRLFAMRASGAALTRWAAPRWPTGKRSRSTSSSTCRWSIRAWIRASPS